MRTTIAKLHDALNYLPYLVVAGLVLFALCWRGPIGESPPEEVVPADPPPFPPPDPTLSGDPDRITENFPHMSAGSPGATG